MTKQRKQMTINLLLALLELDSLSNEGKTLSKDLNKLTFKSLDLLILQINRI